MENSQIQWTDHTFNPWLGCQKVSDGCKFCYAEELMDHRYQKAKWGPEGQRIKTSESYWKQPIKWDRQAKSAGVRKKVFCASLADVFEDKPDQPEMDQWRCDLFNLIEKTPNLDWLLLTKRPENVQKLLSRIARDPEDSDTSLWALYWPLPNVWIGTSVENQEQADKRIPELLKIPAKVRFLSCEPLLEGVDLSKWIGNYFCSDCGYRGFETGPYDNFSDDPEDEAPTCPECGQDIWYFTQTELHGALEDYERNPIHWVIAGGESGKNARPFHLTWAESLLKQCQDADVAFFMKQLGSLPVTDFQSLARLQGDFIGEEIQDSELFKLLLKNKKGGDISEFPLDLRIQEFPV
jgi:protein gp37